MLSLICDDVEDDTAVAVQRDFNSLERHITAIQLRNTFHHYKRIQTQNHWGTRRQHLGTRRQHWRTHWDWGDLRTLVYFRVV